MSRASDSRTTRYLLVTNETLLCDHRERIWLLSSEEAAAWRVDSTPDYLGVWQGVALYSLPQPLEPSVAGGQWLSLRSQLGVLDETLFTLAGRALQIERWRREHRFCGGCGRETQPFDNGAARFCARCELRFYPRLSPCMITLITRDDHCLLARHARSRKAFHTALAGFVEVGETVEDTVHREIQEEVGLKVEAPRYFGSQPWPFPGQLMLGFHAEYRSGDIEVDGDEILTADWWRYDQLPPVPPPQTLAGQLIAHFVATQHNKASQ
ncbi:NAD(+) diphosphatase [Marinimicrobium sp. C2-29]|uniref:NAD(+) diphosphatase n=1 Tax=Marinimicrobium sp. C2-29 TaxID=3139825 RepID=UPI0031392B58